MRPAAWYMPKMASCSEGTMRRGKITSGSASTVGQRSIRLVASACASGSASTSGSCADRQVRQPGGAKPGECSMKPRIDLAARKGLQLHVAGRLDQLELHLGILARKARTQRGSSEKPTVETKAMPQPPEPRRRRWHAHSRQAPGRAPAARAPRAAAPRRPP
jgi:hypothetical protein